MNLYEKIYHKFLDNKMGHAFLIETKNINLSYLKILELCKKINCPNTYNSNCLIDCNLCYLIDNDELTNLIKIEPDGYFIKKEQIQNMKNFFMKNSIYGKYNIYIIVQPERLNLIAANTLLKFLEEPESNTICFMLTNKKENILQTITSRCEFYKDDVAKEPSEEELKKTYDIIMLLESKNDINILKIPKDLSKLSKEEMLNIFQIIYNIYYKCLKENLELCENDKTKSILINNSKEQIENKLKVIKETLDNLTYNVNIELMLNKFLINFMK